MFLHTPAPHDSARSFRLAHIVGRKPNRLLQVRASACLRCQRGYRNHRSRDERSGNTITATARVSGHGTESEYHLPCHLNMAIVLSLLNRNGFGAEPEVAWSANGFSCDNFGVPAELQKTTLVQE